MAGQSQYDAGVAMSGLSCFITPDLARDLANDIMNHVSYFCSYNQGDEFGGSNTAVCARWSAHKSFDAGPGN